MSDYVPYARRQPLRQYNGPRSLAYLDHVEYGPTHQFRIQFLQTLESVIESNVSYNWTSTRREGYIQSAADVWQYILGAISHEFGFSPNVNYYQDHRDAFGEWFLEQTRPMVEILTAIEMAFRVLRDIHNFATQTKPQLLPALTIAQAVDDINVRFNQHHEDYFLDSDSLLIRSVDSQYMNAEVITPVLTLIRQHGFESVEQDFNTALEHHRHNRQEEAISRAANAFENVLKQICDERGWARRPNDTAKDLIAIVLSNNLLPPWMNEQLTQLRILLESGTPTTRNKLSGHASGPVLRRVPPYMAAYALHTAAANILLLIEAHKDPQT